MLHRFVLVSLAVVGLTSVLCSGSLAVEPQDKPTPNPFSLHPENPRYFLFRDQPTVLITSGEHYGLLLNKAFDYQAYFDELAKHGLNHTRVFSGAYREIATSFNITQNTLAPTHDDYICPWQRVQHKHTDGAPKFDLTKWDSAYFQRLRELVSAASKKGIVIELTLFSPMYKPELWDVNPMNVRNNINGIGDCGSQEVYTTLREDLLKVQTTLAQKIVAELLPYDNLYIEVCNEPYFGGVTEQWQRRIIDAIVQKQEDLGCRKLISLNVANKTKRVDDPHPAVSIFNFHYCYPPTAVADNAHLNKPIGENETGFRGRADYLYRTEGWDFMLAGGALYNNLDYSFSTSHPSGTLTNFGSPGGGSRQLRQQLGILKKQIDLLPLPNVKAQSPAFIVASDKLFCSALGKEGDAYLLYAHVRLPGKKDSSEKQEPVERSIEAATLTVDLPMGNYKAWQIDVQNGSERAMESLNSDGKPVTIKLAPFQTDTAVRLIRS